MNLIHKKSGFTLIEFFLSIVALFLLFLIAFPIFQELKGRSQISQIKKNLNQIRIYSDEYFEEHSSNSVSLYHFIGPRKMFPKFETIDDEEYPEKIFRNKEISAFSKKYGVITVE